MCPLNLTLFQLSMGLALHGVHLGVKTVIGYNKNIQSCPGCQFLNEDHTHYTVLAMPKT